MKFSDIIGQDEIKRKLAETVDLGRVSHAQIFTGASGWGALPLAIAYAQYLNCTNRQNGDSCGQCPSCQKIQQLAHPDLHFVFPVNKSPLSTASDNAPAQSDHLIAPWREIVLETGGYFDESQWYRKIQIGNQQGNINQQDANEILRKLSFKSFESEYKIMIVWLPERMKEGTSNTLLKIIEEPWDKTIFLFVSASPEGIIKTILSRTQSVPLHSIDAQLLKETLARKFNLTDQGAEHISRLSMGDYIRAVSLIESSQTDSENLELLRQLLSYSAVNRHLELLDWSENVAELGREEKKLFFNNAIRVLRECYMINMNMGEIVYTSGEELELCRKIAPYIHSENFLAILNQFESARAQIAQNGNPKIILSHFALQLSKLVYKK
jgi:DNA polymerase-3 subunit delta'